MDRAEGTECKNSCVKGKEREDGWPRYCCPLYIQYEDIKTIESGIWWN